MKFWSTWTIVSMAWGLAGIATGEAGSVDRFTEVGEYKVQGTLLEEAAKKRTVLVVFGGSVSEARLEVEGLSSEIQKIHSGKKVLIHGQIQNPVRFQRGKISAQKIQLAVPDYLDPAQGDGFWRVSKQQNKKKK